MRSSRSLEPAEQGEVYRARDTGLGRDVVFVTIIPAGRNDEFEFFLNWFEELKRLVPPTR